MDSLLRLLEKRSILLALLLLIWGVAFALRLPAQISHDPVWLISVAEQVGQGQKLYSDIIVSNLPMSTWLKMPVNWFSELTGLSPVICYKLALFALIFFCRLNCVVD